MESYQIQSLLETLIISGSVLGGLAIAALTWVKTRGRIGGRKDVTKLTESVDGLRDSVEAMRAELGDMSDRLEFTERILGRISEIGGAERLIKGAVSGARWARCCAPPTACSRAVWPT